MIKPRILSAFAVFCLAGAPACGSDGGGEPAAAAGSGGLEIELPGPAVADLSCDVPGTFHECVQIRFSTTREQSLFESECTQFRGTFTRKADSCPAAGRIGSCVSPVESAPGTNRLKVYYEGYSVESARSACEGEQGVFN